MIDGYCTLGVDREYDLTERALLSAMDESGVDKAVVGPVPRCMAVRNREGNDAMRQAAAAHPDRFIPTCTASPWLGDDAVNELKRSASEGARELVVDPAAQGFGLGDELAWPLWEAAIELGLPVYVHTGGYQFGTPAQLALAAQRYTQAMFIMGHCGSTDFKVEAVDVARLCPNVYVESSLTRPFGAVSLLRDLGDERVIMGTAAPLNDFEFEWCETLAVLPPADCPGFYGGTLSKVLGEMQA